MSDHPLPRDLLPLIESLIDDTIDDADFARLDAILSQDAVARRFYRRYMNLHAALPGLIGNAPRLTLGLSDQPGDQLAAVGHLPDAKLVRLLLEVEASADSIDLVDATELIALRRRENRRPRFAAPLPLIYSGVAAVLVLALTLIFAFTGGPTGPEPTANNSQTPVAPQTPDSAPSRIVATLTATHNAVWSQPSAERALARGSELRPNQRLTLTQGFAQITTHSGAVALLEAPCTVELLDNANALRLVTGKLVGICESDASKGFIVRAPGGRIIDYGTVFGVAVDEMGTTLTHVFAGDVEVVSDIRDGRPGLRLYAGEAATLSPNRKVERTAAAPQRFAREMPATGYQASVLASRPMCYWRGPIDEATSIITDHGWLGAHGQAAASLSNNRDGFTPTDPTGSLDFGSRQPGAVSVPYQDALAFTDAFTIEVWCWIEPGHREFMRIVSTRTEHGGIGLGVNGPDAEIFADLPANIPVLTFFTSKDFVATRALPEGRWTHLVATVDQRGAVHMFIDGVETPTQVITTGIEDARAGTVESPLMLGRNPYTELGAQPWQGRLDEVAIYDRALSQNEINEHRNALTGP